MMLQDKIVEFIKERVEWSGDLKCRVIDTVSRTIELSDGTQVDKHGDSHVEIYTESTTKSVCCTLSVVTIPIFDARSLVSNGVSVTDLIDISKLVSELLSEQVLLLIDNDYSLQVKA